MGLTVKAFAVALSNALINKGIDKETAVTNVLKITRSLSEDDLREIALYETPEDFAALSEALVKLIEDANRAAIIEDEVKRPVVTDDDSAATKQITSAGNMRTAEFDAMAQTRQIPHQKASAGNYDTNSATKTIPVQRNTADTDMNASTRTIPVQKSAADTDMNASTRTIPVQKSPVGTDSKAETRQISVKKETTAETDLSSATREINKPHKVTPPEDNANEIILDESTFNDRKTHYTEYKKTKLTPRGAKFFWTIFALTLPLTILAAVVYFGIFALCVVSVAALIVACFVLLGVIVIAGSLACLISIIFGVIQMFSSLGIGLYEIGVGIVASGLAVLLSVLIYLVATRALPYLLRQLVAFSGHTLGQIPGLVDRAREECNKI